MKDITKTISDLISIKDEGGYWDFKEFWEEDKKKSDLLHDIICMANNLEDRDAYIIYGVRNSTFDIVGIENDTNRLNRQNVIDFLKDKEFAGDIRPIIDLQTIQLDGHKLDVLIIKNTDNTPYYLKERYNNVQANLIYTRIKDTNTPKDRNADIDKIEYLWKKRFGLTKSGIDKMSVFLEDYNNWENEFGNDNEIFYKLLPEYKIQIKEFYKFREPLADFYLNNDSTLYEAELICSNTVLYKTNIIAVDEFRKYIVAPKPGLYDNLNSDSLYYYYIIDSIDGKVLNVLTHGNFNINSREFYDIPVLFFNTEEEKKLYMNYAKLNKNKILQKDIEEFIEPIHNSKFFKDEHYAYIKSYLLYKNWINKN